MPLYTDANYYYSGGSSQLYSPYYPGSSSSIPTSSGIYSPYSSSYSRIIGGTYAVPIPTSRTPSFTSTHVLSSSRYQPKLSTITETSPLISSARHKSLMPLTRIQSPKYTSYVTPTAVHTPKYIPPRPILINTADIDVSANRYRKRKEEALRQAQRDAEYTSPKSSLKRRNSNELQKKPPEQTQPKEIVTPMVISEKTADASPEQHVYRSTIKRDRAVVRLSTIRSRSKDCTKKKTEESLYPAQEKSFKDLPIFQSPEEVPLKWRDKLADDLAAIPSYSNKKSPGDILKEKYLIQDTQDNEDFAAQCRIQRTTAVLPKQTIEQVVVELDPLHHTVSRLSMPQCPTFHDICEDISSDKIDDDLNAGELRRRVSIIQSHEQDLLNELQKSASGTFQMITMERRGSHDSVDELPHKRHSKRSSKKGKKIRTKITAIVGIENAPLLDTIAQENEEEFNANMKTPRPKFTVNVESMEEHHKIQTVFKLPKKKSIKRVLNAKEQQLPEGFMSPIPKPQGSPKKKHIKPTPEVFTFDEAYFDQSLQDETQANSLTIPEITANSLNDHEPKNKKDINETKPVTSPKPVKIELMKSSLEVKEQMLTLDGSKVPELKEISVATKPNEKTNLNYIEPKTPTLFQTAVEKQPTFKPLEKSTSLNIELKPPISPKEKETPTISEQKGHVQTPLEKSSSLNIEFKTSTIHQVVIKNEQVLTQMPKPSKSTSKTAQLTGGVHKSPLKKEQYIELKTAQSLDCITTPKPPKLSEISSLVNIELKAPASPKTEVPNTTKERESEIKVATPKPIKKSLIKSDSAEDFWAQIGTRETLYMNKRKNDIAEFQSQKREELMENTNIDDLRSIQAIETKVTSQKIDTLKQAEKEQNISQADQTKSNFNERQLPSGLKSIEIDHKETQVNKNETSLNKNKEDIKTSLTSKDLKNIDSKNTTNDKLEISNTPAVTKTSKGASLLTSPTSLLATTPLTKTSLMATTSNITTSPKPKIIGQPAKSPEQQEKAEQNKSNPTTTITTNDKSNKNENETDINKETAANEKKLLAKTFTLPTEKTKITASTSAAKSVAELTTTKQPETKQTLVHQQTTITETNNAVTKSQTTVTDHNKFTAPKIVEQPTVSKSSIAQETKTTSNVINANQFANKVPAKLKASPVNATKKPTTPTQAATSSNIKQITDKKTTTTASTNEKINAADTATTTTIQTATKADDNQQICNKSKDKISTAETTTNTSRNNKNNDDDETNNNTSSTCGGNLSKFATVSNLAQCLHDVDADLADYLPSSAEISENEDYKTDDSDFDYSSVDGWEKLTPSMKKKVKQRRRKEKQAEQARFDPQKKVKIDTTRKLYVKEEAPRFPLVATPRPLWKREKIVYPVHHSDDESDSEESGSTEETEESDESTTSEEYEDEMNPTPSGGIKSDSGASGDGGISDTNKENSLIIRMSTCSNDSGFEGGTAPASPKKMLECDVNCHKKCERLTANLCGVNQKLIVEALANVKRGARETRDSPSTPPSSNPAYTIEATEEQDETSYTYSQFQKSGRFTPPATIIPRFKNYTVDDFHFLAVLGKGSFGKVLLAELRDTTYYYAVKCLKKDVVLEDDDVDSTLIERKVLALGTKHPYLCHLFCTFQTESHLFFVMEYLNGGDLMFHIQESGRFTEERARFYGAEIVSGLKFLHKKGIIYRDLKLDNVLLDYEGHVRIADFGMCKLQIYLDKTADSFCGTPDYMAPEIIKGDKYNQYVDWWSFGVLLYEMLIGQSPFSGCDEDELFWSICNELPWFPVYISAEATSILKELLEKDFAKRIGSHYSPAGDIVEHIFFRPIDWNLLEKRQIEPPFRPQVKHPLDTQYFDRVFTRERVRLTPIDKDILQSMDQKQFLGFTYTNPHITLD